MSNDLKKLSALLSDVPPGPLSPEIETAATSLLFACWNDLQGSREGGMTGMKLIGRLESVTWQPPNLKFDIERHGAAVMGSIYAEMQSWAIDVVAGSASYSKYDSRKRRIGAADKPLKVAPLATEVAEAIVAGRSDDRLKWLSANRVRLEVGVIIEATNKETTAARRRRFAGAIDTELAARGWNRMEGRRNTFEKIDNALTKE